MQKSDFAFAMAGRPCDFDDENDSIRELPDWDVVRQGMLTFFHPSLDYWILI